MDDSVENNHQEKKRKSKRIRKINLLDFVVVKHKNKKTQQVSRVKVSKQIQKRGKVRKKNITTFKKRILKERLEKNVGKVIDQIALIQLDEAPAALKPDTISDKPVSQTPCLTKHSRNFREYCNHLITQEIRNLTEVVLKDLFKFQENKFQKNPSEIF